MMDFDFIKFGKLYQYSGPAFLLLFSTLDGAVNHFRSHGGGTPPGILDPVNFVDDTRHPLEIAQVILAYWSRCSECGIQPISPGEYIVVLEEQKNVDTHLLKVLGPGSVGWIIIGGWLSKSFELVISGT